MVKNCSRITSAESDSFGAESFAPSPATLPLQSLARGMMNGSIALENDLSVTAHQRPLCALKYAWAYLPSSWKRSFRRIQSTCNSPFLEGLGLAIPVPLVFERRHPAGYRQLLELSFAAISRDHLLGPANRWIAVYGRRVTRLSGCCTVGMAVWRTCLFSECATGYQLAAGGNPTTVGF